MNTNRKVRVNIIVGRFQPITKGHLKCIKYIWEKYNTPTVILMIDTKVPNERHPFTSNVLVPMYKELFKSSPMIADILLVKNADIVMIRIRNSRRSIMIKRVFQMILKW